VDSQRIEVLNGQISDEIRQFVESCSTSLIYQSPKFVSFLTRHLDGQAIWFVLRKHNQIKCVLPAIAKTSLDGRTVVNSLPFFGSNGSVIHNKASKEQIISLVTFFLEWASLEGSVSVTIVSNPLDPDSIEALEQIQWDFRKERISQITDIEGIRSATDLLVAFDDPRPRNIRKALKEGVSVSKSKSLESIRFLVETHTANLEAIGGTSKSPLFFQEVFDTFDGSEVELYIGSLGVHKVAALLVFNYNGIAEYFTPAVVADFRNTQALSLVIFEAMVSSLNSEMRMWNWGGTWTTQKGVYDFKKKWGAEDRSYFVYTQVFDKSILDNSKFDISHQWPGFYVVPFDELSNP
jgi:hypothetical protein